MLSCLTQEEVKIIAQQGILVMVSGGLDSMGLLHEIYQSLLSFCKSDLKHRIAVLHVNHQLRGLDSDKDEQLVREICAKWEIPFFVQRLTITKKKGLPHLARRARYLKAREIAAKNNLGVIATAHHRDDNYETLIQRKARGTGALGVTGIWRQRLFKTRIRSYLYLRPLISHTKQEIKASLEFYDIPYRHDVSNDKPTILRNRIRLAIKKCALETQTISPELQTFLDANGVAIKYFQFRTQELIKEYGSQLPFRVWQKLPSTLQYFWLKHFVKMMGFREQLEEHHMQSIKALREGQSLRLNSAIILRTREFIKIKSSEIKPNILCEIDLAELSFAKYFGSNRVKLIVTDKEPMCSPKTYYVWDEKRLRQLCADGKLYVTFARLSETMRVNGHDSDQSLARLYNSRKVDPALRSEALVLRNHAGMILALSCQYDHRDLQTSTFTEARRYIHFAGPLV